MKPHLYFDRIFVMSYSAAYYCVLYCTVLIIKKQRCIFRTFRFTWQSLIMEKEGSADVGVSLKTVRDYSTIQCVCWFGYWIVFMCYNFNIFCWLLCKILCHEWCFTPFTAVDITSFRSHACCLFFFDICWAPLRESIRLLLDCNWIKREV